MASPDPRAEKIKRLHRPPLIPTIGPDISTEASAFESRRAECARFEKDWWEWAQSQPIAFCASHPRVKLAPDPLSIAESFETGENVLRYVTCCQCSEVAAQARVTARIIRRGVPDALAHCTLSNWNATTNNDASALSCVKMFAQSPKGGLVLISSNYGVGKTHLAVGAMRVQSEALFVVWPSFLLKLRATYGGRGDSDALIEKLRSVPFLVLDEFGLSTAGADEAPLIYDVINTRHGKKRPFIITGNFANAEDFARAAGPKIASRLEECIFATLVLAGKSQRSARRSEYLGLA